MISQKEILKEKKLKAQIKVQNNYIIIYFLLKNRTK